ncbi:ISSod13, transposase [uncultured Leptolyngbya sp.]|uniref:ISSod13, transposase n=1 Tax=uncultured Leptolyngbya sp. TaxID=332963 RepID=A0A6J4NUA0_9CYAN|nr:ISSod13, transposase [uncultured Leptolyngbya sp.]
MRKKLYSSLEELRADLDEWLLEYNCDRSHSGKYCYGKTPMQTFLDSKHLASEKMLDQQLELKQPSKTRELFSVS